MKFEFLHRDFKVMPYWWEAYKPNADDMVDVPKKARVAIVGGGYAGLSCAMELADNGVDCVVLEARELGYGASTRSGGGVSAGLNIGRSLSGRRMNMHSDVMAGLIASGVDSFNLIEKLIEREKIDCVWEKNGRFVGAWSLQVYEAQAKRVEVYNAKGNFGTYMIPRDRVREEVATDYYYGGMVVERAAKLHPALYFKGMLDAVQRRGVPVCAMAPATKIEQRNNGWIVKTPRGDVEASEVVIATNGYTGGVTPQLQKRMVPIASHIIATEELPPDLAKSLLPKGRSSSTSRRVSNYYRISPDGKRMTFGGRSRFTPVTPDISAPILYRQMTELFPQMKGVKITHAWTGNVGFTFDALAHTGKMEGLHYALGCNGSGIALMTYLGHQVARRIAGVPYTCGFELEDFPTMPLYGGNPAWILPFVGAYFRHLDMKERRESQKISPI